MLRSVSELEKYTIGAADGAIGSVKDCYFDDEAWVIRYLVVATGAWLVGREVLISPFSVGDPDENARVLPVSLTKDQVRHSPNIDSEKPVSRQHEIGYSAYYGYPNYWGGAGFWGEVAYPRAVMTGGAGLRSSADAHPRSQDHPEHALYARETTRQTQPWTAGAQWSSLSQVRRIARWVIARPMRPATLHAVNAALVQTQ